MRTRLLSICLAGFMLLAAAPARAATPDHADGIEHLDSDVYVVYGSTLRHPTDVPSGPDDQLFNDAGVALGVTWGQWQQATATSVARLSRGRALRTSVRLRLQGLIPNGQYSLFYITIGPDSEHPQCRGVERSLPVRLRTRSGDPSAFVARRDGTAYASGEVAGDILAAREVYLSVIYHFDGRTYHPFPNALEKVTYENGSECRSSFGHDAMRQIYVVQKLS